MKSFLIILFIIIFIIGIYILLALSESLYSINTQVNNRKITLTGHRGAGGLAPENTLAAIKKGLDNHVDRIEIDVQQSKDNVVVVMHDESIDRTTNGKGLVKDLNFSELRSFSAGIKFSDKYKSEKIPSLDEVFQLINSKAVLLIEIKKGNDYYPGIEQNVINAIHKHNAASWTIIHSFNDKALKKVHQLDSSIALHKLFVAKLPFLPIFYDDEFKITKLKDYDYVDEFSFFYPFATKRLIKKIHALGKKINVWTVDDSLKINRFINMNIDGIITNYPNYLHRK